MNANEPHTTDNVTAQTEKLRKTADKLEQIAKYHTADWRDEELFCDAAKQMCDAADTIEEIARQLRKLGIEV